MSILKDMSGAGADIPSAPDYQTEIWGLEQLAEWNKGFIEETRDLSDQIRAEQGEFVNEIYGGIQQPLMEDMFQWAQEDRETYKELALPAYERYAGRAEQMSSEGEQRKQRAIAAQDTGAAFEAQRAQRERELASMGIVRDPNQASSRMEDLVSSMGQATAQGQNMNVAANQAAAYGDQMTANVNQMGNQINAQATQNAGAAGNLGTQALSGLQNYGALSLDANNAVVPFIGAGNNLYNSAGQMKHLDFTDKTAVMDMENAADGAAWKTIGQVGGAVIGGIYGGPAGATAGAEAGGSIGGAATGGAINVPGYEHGGPVIAPGTTTSDSGLMRLSDGEYVLPAEVVNNLGASMLDKYVAKQTGVEPAAKQALPVPGAI